MTFFGILSYLLFLIISINIFHISFAIQLSDFATPGEDIDHDIHEIIKSRGFNSEKMFVITPDGYILQMVRLVNPHVKDRSKLKPVLLQHGFQCTGTFWILTNSGKLMPDGHYYELDENQRLVNTSIEFGNTLSFVLATRGYDVWIANYRGSIYSDRHARYSRESTQYWSFSLDEMALIDLPAMIDHILIKTNRSSLAYIGHSQANFMMLALQSTRPEYSAKVKPYIALSPVFYLGQIKTAFKYYMPIKDVLVSYPTIVPFKEEARKTYRHLCEKESMIQVCYQMYQYYVGGEPQHLNMQRLPVYLAHVPMGSSAWNAAQLLQTINRGTPTKFDFGPEKNLKKYGSTEPPMYDASRINSTDIALFYLKNDFFNSLYNVHDLKGRLRVKLIDDYLLDDDTLGHMDFVWSKNAGQIVNRRILQILSKY